MLSYFIGTFDWPATFVVVGSLCALALGLTAWINRTPFRIQEMKIQSERELGIANVERQRACDLAKIDQKVITSHRSEEG